MLDMTDQNEMTVDEKRQTEVETPPRAAPHDPKPRRVGVTALILLVVAASALGVVIYRGISSRTKATVQLARATDASAVPTVVVTYPKANA
ncbi:MAG: hypothetical protein WB676_24340, partial [Bryobacteraceae bacterium]